MKSLLLSLALVATFFASASAQTVITPAATINLHPGQNLATPQVKLYTLTPGQDETINAVGDGFQIGTPLLMSITSSGSTSFEVKFNQNFTGLGSLQTGTTTAITWMIEWIWDGTNFQEVRRQRQSNAFVTVTDGSGTTTLNYSEGAVYVWTPSQASTIAFDKVPRKGAIISIHLIGSGSFAVTATGNVKMASTTVTAANDAFFMFESDGTSIWQLNGSTVYGH
jgi:hypothetical protein